MRATYELHSKLNADPAIRDRQRVCTLLARAAGDSEWQPLLEELREVLREHDRWVRTVAAGTAA